MLSKFFLDRPVFAWVLAITTMVAGGLAIYGLPVSQYPPIAPPSISIDAFYAGASAETVENTVVQLIEQKMTGFDNLLYLSARSSSSGSGRIELTFAPGTDPDFAWSQVQNKLQLAMASLPDVVQRQGVKVSKSTRNFLIIVGLISEDGNFNQWDLGDFAQSRVEQVLSRVPGVGEVEIFGGQYAMRVWLDSEKLNKYQMTINDVLAALQNYNVQVSAGQFGAVPAVEGQRLNASIVVQNLLSTPEEFANVPLRINSDGSIVRVSDVGRTELGAERYGAEVRFEGKPATALAIRQAAGANALETADNIKKALEDLAPFFPPGVKVIYPYDTTPFVRVAIGEVIKTLLEAIVLVFLVMYLFMGNLRATLIPTIAVPVVILGTFATLGFFGFSINMLTMFAMVLAIGLLVDDAIVVVENVERVMTEEGLSPYEATAKSMNEITSALIGIGLVLSAVFGPMAFFGGSTGVIYRQFSVTIIASMVLSVFVALILTPVLCASLLKPVEKGHEPAENAFRPLRPFFRWFDRTFFRARSNYIWVVSHILKRRLPYVGVFVMIVVAMVLLFKRMPTAYLPDEDQGIMFVQATLPTGSTLEQTTEIMTQVQKYFNENEKEAVASVLTIAGSSFAGQSQNSGMAFIKLRDWDDRHDESLKVKAVVGRAMGYFSSIRNAMVFAFPPPAVTELGQAGGFDMQLVNRAGAPHVDLMKAREQLLDMANKDPRVVRVRANGLDDVPEYRLNIDWEKAGMLGVPINAIHRTVSAAFGSAYVNDFVQNNRVKRVIAQADPEDRMLPQDINKLYVRNTKGKMVPFSAFSDGHWDFGPQSLERFNGFPSLNIIGEPAPGQSSGEAMNVMQSLVAKLPPGFDADWAGLSYQERQSGSQAPFLYAFSILVIFLCLAALYESWPIPISILLALPLGIIGGIIATSVRGFPNDVYFQIGLLTTLGLTTKNAILIVQFAKARMEDGMGLVEATVEASKLRLRPILMTSLAFGFGVLPLAIASGAGAGAQQAIGTSVIGGVITSTFLVTIFAPLFFVLIERLFGKKDKTNGNGNGSGSGKNK